MLWFRKKKKEFSREELEKAATETKKSVSGRANPNQSPTGRTGTNLPDEPTRN